MSRISLLFLLAACSSSDPGPTGTPGGGATPGLGVGQGGAQDFGRFRQILDEGGIPGPETLDDVGFFAEHRFELPPPDCGEDVCIQGLYGAMDNMIDGSVCTVVLIGMNTPLDPATIEVPPLDLTVVVDTSGSMTGQPIADVRQGLTSMLDVLGPDDTLSIVGFDDTAEALVVGEAPDSAAVASAIDALEASGSTDLYGGLRLGFETASDLVLPGRQSRLVLLSDGVATDGIEHGARMVALTEASAAQGLSLTTIGLGTEFDVELLRDLAEEGAGSFYFVEDSGALGEVFVEEARVFLVPLAEQALITLDAESAWEIRGVYGTRLFEFGRSQAQIEVPRLQIAGRTDDPDQAPPTRRGGGGAIVVELLPRGGGALVGDVGTLELSYTVPGTKKLVEQSLVVEGPGRFADGDRFFFHPSVEKGFVTLNLYVAFRMAAEAASGGDDGAALGVLDAVAVNVADWLRDNPDSDIQDDLVYVDRFRENLLERSPEPQRPPDNDPPWPQD